MQQLAGAGAFSLHAAVVFPLFPLFPQIAELSAIGVLTSNEGTVICEIDGLVLGGVQFGVLVYVGAVWGAI